MRTFILGVTFVFSLQAQAQAYGGLAQGQCLKSQDQITTSGARSSASTPAHGNDAAQNASEILATVSQKSNNYTLDPVWMDNFFACLQASGRKLNEIVPNQRQFEQLVARTLKGNLDDLQNKAVAGPVSEEFAKFHGRVNLAQVYDFNLARSEIARSYTISPKSEANLIKEMALGVDEERAKCTTKDYSPILGPVRDQDGVGWCYAYAASELATFKKMKKDGSILAGLQSVEITAKLRKAGVGPAPIFDPNIPPKDRVSAVDIAMQFNRHYKLDTSTTEGLDETAQHGGDVGAALESTLESGGFCPEKNLPSDDYAFGTIKETLDQIEKFKTDPVATDLNAQCFQYNHTHEMFPDVKFDDFQKILAKVGDTNNEYLNQLDRKSCEGHRSSPFTKDDIVETGAGEDPHNAVPIIEAIDDQLDHGNIAAVGFHMSMIAPGETGDHAVTVVGRAFNETTRKCIYELRNQWGGGCPPPLNIDNCDPNKSGHVWVTKEQLMKDAINVTYIK